MGFPAAPSPTFSNDHDCIRRSLSSIIQNEGVSILDNPKRVRALLSDYCAGDQKREILLLEHLLDEKIHLEIIHQKNSLSYDILSANLTHRILANNPFDKDLVESGIDTLALALEIIKIRPVRQNMPKKIQSHASGSVGKTDAVSQQDNNYSENDLALTQAIKFNQSKSFQNAIPLLTRVLENDPINAIALRKKEVAPITSHSKPSHIKLKTSFLTKLKDNFIIFITLSFIICFIIGFILIVLFSLMFFFNWPDLTAFYQIYTIGGVELHITNPTTVGVLGFWSVFGSILGFSLLIVGCHN